MMNFKYSWFVIFMLTINRSASSFFLNNTALFGPSTRGALNFTELVAYDGYASESHTVTTSDGYILALYRIPVKKSCETSHGVMVFMHGLYLSGGDCVIPGPGVAHCYIYADNCYDMWIPNCRGNRYSRKHVTYNPDEDSEFWDFSFDEMATRDLPAILDYILEETGETQVSYVGHSQGVTLLLVLCAKQPEYNNKILVGFGLSTTAWLDHSQFLLVELQGVLSPLLTAAINAGLNQEFLGHGNLGQSAVNWLCSKSVLSYPLCSVAIFAIFGYNKYQITKEVLPVVVGHTPAGTSLKDFTHWAQIKSDSFREYDYGELRNWQVYGSFTPSMYDLNAVNMTWIFLASENDNVGDIKDLYKLTSTLKNYEICILKDKYFDHLDFIYGKDIPNYLARTILAYTQNKTLNCY